MTFSFSFFLGALRVNEKWRAGCMHYKDSADEDTQSVEVIHYAVMNDRHVAVHHITESQGIRVFSIRVALINISGDVQTHSCYLFLVQ